MVHSATFCLCVVLRRAISLVATLSAVLHAFLDNFTKPVRAPISWKYKILALPHMMQAVRRTLNEMLLSFAANILRCGKIPRHVAVIMDGNRRYSRTKQMPIRDVHLKGFGLLDDAVEMSVRLGVKEITIFVFSIDNFGRSKEEQDYLFKLFLKDHSIHDVFLREAHIRIIGDLKGFPLAMQKKLLNYAYLTRDNVGKVRVNLAFGYGGMQDMTQAVKHVLNGLSSESILPEDVNAGLIEAALETEDGYPVDLLIRTAGDPRISNFVLWQSSHAVLSFISPFWPEYSKWEFLKSILNFQRSTAPEKPRLPVVTERGQRFLSKLYIDRFREVESRIKSQTHCPWGYEGY